MPKSKSPSETSYNIVETAEFNDIDKKLKDFGILLKNVIDIEAKSNNINNELASNKKNIDVNSDKNTIKIPNIHKRKVSGYSSIINYEEDSPLNLTYTSLNLIRANCELNFESDFIYESSSFEFSSGLFFTPIKLKLEYCRIVCSNLKERHKIINNQEIILRPLLCLDFNQVSAKIFVNRTKKQFKIMVLGCKEKFKFKTKSEGVFDSLLVYLNYYISISKGSKDNLLGISLRKDFYKVIL